MLPAGGRVDDKGFTGMPSWRVSGSRGRPESNKSRGRGTGYFLTTGGVSLNFSSEIGSLTSNVIELSEPNRR